MSNKDIDARLSEVPERRKRNPIYISSGSLIFLKAWLHGSWDGIRAVVALVKECGLEGIEWLLLRPFVGSTAIQEVYEASEKQGLGCRFHQMWNAVSLSTLVFRFLKLLPDSCWMERCVEKAAKIAPTVTFASWSGVWGSNNVIQTGGNMGQGIDSIDDLIDSTNLSEAQLAFDWMHYLEFLFGDFVGLSRVWRHNPRRVDREVLDFFEKYRALIGEIHLYQSSALPEWILRLPAPDVLKLAVADIFYKNLSPNRKGMLDIEALLQAVGASGWSGPIVLEIHPLRLQFDKIAKLRSTVEWVKQVLSR